MRRSLYASSRFASRRRFCGLAVMLCGDLAVPRRSPAQGATGVHFNVAEWDRARILAMAQTALHADAQPIASLPAPARAALPPRTFYSEPSIFSADPKSDDGSKDGSKGSGRDGQDDAAAFVQHADALVAINVHVGASVAAWQLTRDERYAANAWRLLRPWFLDPSTAMLPSFDHAGVRDGEGTVEGIADATPLVEIVRAASLLCADPAAAEGDAQALRGWCGALLQWMTESRLGGLARDRADRFAICWTALASELARFTRAYPVQRDCTHRFRDKLVRQMNFDGAFPQALSSSRPFGTSLFTLECLSLACESLSTPFDSLWRFQLPDGRGMRSAIAFHAPAMANRGRWPYTADVQHYSDLPVRGVALLLAARAYDRPEYADAWKTLRPDPASAAVARQTPARQPALWAQRPPA